MGEWGGDSASSNGLLSRSLEPCSSTDGVGDGTIYTEERNGFSALTYEDTSPSRRSTKLRDVGPIFAGKCGVTGGDVLATGYGWEWKEVEEEARRREG